MGMRRQSSSCMVVKAGKWFMSNMSEYLNSAVGDCRHAPTKHLRGFFHDHAPYMMTIILILIP